MAAISMEYTARNSLYTGTDDTSVTGSTSLTCTVTYTSSTDSDLTYAPRIRVHRNVAYVSAPTPAPEFEFEKSDYYIPEIPMRPWSWDKKPEIRLLEIKCPKTHARSPRGPLCFFIYLYVAFSNHSI